MATIGTAADDLPAFELSTNTTLCTHNPLGVKGCGEAGAIGAPRLSPMRSSMR